MENLKISILSEIYGKLLTEKQRDLLSLYYDCDLSLKEIAEQYGISRQAARDSIKRGEESLMDFEEKLNLFQKNTANRNCAMKIKAAYDLDDQNALKCAIDELINLTEG